jgi:hypothetical protein
MSSRNKPLQEEHVNVLHNSVTEILRAHGIVIETTNGCHTVSFVSTGMTLYVAPSKFGNVRVNGCTTFTTGGDNEASPEECLRSLYAILADVDSLISKLVMIKSESSKAIIGLRGGKN